MAFTRNFLKSAGLTDDQISAVMDEHVSVTDALKQKVADAEKKAEEYKTEADKLPDIQKKLDDLTKEGWKEKHDKVVKELNDLKEAEAAKENRAKVETAYRKLLKDEKIAEKWHDRVIGWQNLDKLKLDKDGNLENLDDLKKEIVEKWGDCKVSTVERGVSIQTPHNENNDGGSTGYAAQRAARFAKERYGLINQGKDETK